MQPEGENVATTAEKAKDKPRSRPIVAQRQEGAEALLAWVKAHRTGLAWGIGIVLIGGGLFGWKLLSTRQAERVASAQLSTARFALESKNYALAASELARIMENYSGTRSANEAAILLAQTRLDQGQSDQAVTVLRDFAPKASADYRAQAYGLLGAAYENLAHSKDAAQAYQQAAQDAEMPFLKAGFLSDAARAWLAAGDTAQARSAYEEIVSKMDSTSTVFEAKERLGELSGRAAR
jgi:predicted negative regulator of RcsB-dependent stress response